MLDCIYIYIYAHGEKNGKSERVLKNTTPSRNMCTYNATKHKTPHALFGKEAHHCAEVAVGHLHHGRYWKHISCLFSFGGHLHAIMRWRLGFGQRRACCDAYRWPRRLCSHIQSVQNLSWSQSMPLQVLTLGLIVLSRLTRMYALFALFRRLSPLFLMDLQVGQRSLLVRPMLLPVLSPMLIHAILLFLGRIYSVVLSHSRFQRSEAIAMRYTHLRVHAQQWYAKGPPAIHQRDDATFWHDNAPLTCSGLLESPCRNWHIVVTITVVIMGATIEIVAIISILSLSPWVWRKLTTHADGQNGHKSVQEITPACVAQVTFGNV